MSPALAPRLLERIIAIDHACGWPNLTLLPDGSLAALVWPEPCHGLWEGAAVCWVSSDGGRNWTKRGVPVPHTPGTNRMNLAAGLACDGALVAVVAGWDGRPPRGTPASHVGQNLMPPIPARSRDGGHTWENFAVPVAPAEAVGPHYGDGRRFGQAGGGASLVPFGDIWPLGDGTLGFMAYTNRVHFYVSADDGRSWTHRATFGTPDGHNETTWLPLPDGRLIAAARTCGDQHLDLFVSPDSGRTWTFTQAVTGKGEHPAALTALADGGLLLTYGIRTEPLFGIGVRLSRDQGRTWSEPRTLVDMETSTNSSDPNPTARDGGYPATVQLADGTLVTAYYCKGTPAHTRYHVGVVRWMI
jgi:hypothetical protein